LIDRQHLDVIQYRGSHEGSAVLILTGSHHIDAIAWQQETGYSDNVIDAHRDSAFVFRNHGGKCAACTVFREQGCHQHLTGREHWRW